MKPVTELNKRKTKQEHSCDVQMKGLVAALVRSRTNGLLPFQSTIEQITETMPLALKQ